MIVPPKTSLWGTRRASIAATMAKLPPPPRSAQNSSGSLSASTWRCSPSAVTTSIAVSRLQAKPYLRPSQPTPPPSE